MAILAGRETIQRDTGSPDGGPGYLEPAAAAPGWTCWAAGWLPPERADAGRLLGKLGDPRPGVGLRSDGLPDIAWCEVPAGEFIMGSKDDEPGFIGNETPQHRLRLGAFRISKYPVTLAQFTAFASDRGYSNARFWQQAQKAGLWQQGKLHGFHWDPKALKRQEDWFDKPSNPDEPFNVGNHPMVEVNWYEAIAFCLWLGDKLEQQVTLPTEAQWERAARGMDGWTYPWGEKLTRDHANYNEAGMGTTTAVGIFPRGANPETGVQDMSGNVWEWTRSIWGDDLQKSGYNYPYTIGD